MRGEIEIEIGQERFPTDTVLERWGDAIGGGFIALPNSLVRGQAELGLGANELIVILNLLLHWWHRDHFPFPRSSAIAKRSGLGRRTVQRALSELERKGLVVRKKGSGDEEAVYDLTGLRDALARIARSDSWHRQRCATRASTEWGRGRVRRP